MLWELMILAMEGSCRKILVSKVHVLLELHRLQSKSFQVRSVYSLELFNRMMFPIQRVTVSDQVKLLHQRLLPSLNQSRLNALNVRMLLLIFNHLWFWFSCLLSWLSLNKRKTKGLPKSYIRTRMDLTSFFKGSLWLFLLKRNPSQFLICICVVRLCQFFVLSSFSFGTIILDFFF